MKIMIVILILIGILILIVFPVLFQEGNPLPLIYGIIRLSFGDDDMIRISAVPLKYLSKTVSGDVVLLEMMESGGWRFTEQMGAAYLFEKAGQKITVTGRQYTRKYKVWQFPDF